MHKHYEHKFLRVLCTGIIFTPPPSISFQYDAPVAQVKH